MQMLLNFFFFEKKIIKLKKYLIKFIENLLENEKFYITNNYL